MFARNAKAVLTLILAVLVSNGTSLFSSSFKPAQDHHLQDHQYRQSKRHFSFGNQVPDRWLLYARDDDAGRPTFQDPLSRPPWKKKFLRYDYDYPTPSYNNFQDFSFNIHPPQRFRSLRKHRIYDVPLIECPRTKTGMDRFACPSSDITGRHRCINDHHLCDGFIDCPNGEDEDRQACMFYKTTKSHLDVIADAVLRWARGR